MTIENNASFKCYFTAKSGTCVRRLSGERDLLDGPLILMIKVVAKENGLPGFAFGVANQKEGLNLYSLGMHNYEWNERCSFLF